jgi:hypothetical protein
MCDQEFFQCYDVIYLNHKEIKKEKRHKKRSLRIYVYMCIHKYKKKDIYIHTYIRIEITYMNMYI